MSSFCQNEIKIFYKGCRLKSKEVSPGIILHSKCPGQISEPSAGYGNDTITSNTALVQTEIKTLSETHDLKDHGG